jgi:hypothetical protein
MLPEFPPGAVAVLLSRAAHSEALTSSRCQIAFKSVRRSHPKPDSRPASPQPGLAYPLLTSLSRALRQDRTDSIPIAPPSARWFSPTGFLAYRTRWPHRTTYQPRYAAFARLKTLCIRRHTQIAEADTYRWRKDEQKLHLVPRVSRGAIGYQAAQLCSLGFGRVSGYYGTDA